MRFFRYPIRPFRGYWQDFCVVSRFNLSALNACVGATGCVVSGGDLRTAALVSVGVFSSAVWTSIWNQSLELDHDRLMNRTKTRVRTLIAYARNTSLNRRGLETLAMGGTILSSYGLALATTPVAGFFTLLTSAVYIYAYTPVKTRSHLNTELGAIVGALVPIVGFTSHPNSVYSSLGLMLVTFMYAWQIPHFMIICHKYRHEYANAGYVMMSAVDPTGKRGQKKMLRYSAFMAVLPILNELMQAPKDGWVPDFTALCNVRLVLLLAANLSAYFAIRKLCNKWSPPNVSKAMRALYLQLLGTCGVIGTSMFIETHWPDIDPTFGNFWPFAEPIANEDASQFLEVEKSAPSLAK